MRVNVKEHSSLERHTTFNIAKSSRDWEDRSNIQNRAAFRHSIGVQGAEGEEDGGNPHSPVEFDLSVRN